MPRELKRVKKKLARPEAGFDHGPLKRFFIKREFDVLSHEDASGFIAAKPTGLAYELTNSTLKILPPVESPHKFRMLAVEVSSSWETGKDAGGAPVREDGKVQCVHWRDTGEPDLKMAQFFTLDLDHGLIVTQHGEASLGQLRMRHMKRESLPQNLEIDVGRVLEAIEAGEFEGGKLVTKRRKRP